MIHLDTSFLIRALTASSSESKILKTWIVRSETLGMSTLAWAEFLCGPLSSDEAGIAGSIVSVTVPFGQADAELAAYLFNHGGRKRGSFVDCMIAATAIRSDAALATSERAFFSRFESHGLRMAREH